MDRECSFEGCKTEVICKGLCWAHYRQQLRGIKLKPKKTRTERDAEGKVCKGCKTYKKYAEYYVNRRMKDGVQALCKVCHKAAIARKREERQAA